MKKIKIVLTTVAMAITAVFAFRTQQEPCLLYKFNTVTKYCDIPTYDVYSYDGFGILTEEYATTPGTCEILVVKDCSSK